MTEERKITREGIHIDRDVAEAVAIEDELDSNVVGPYVFPDPRRRRTPAVIYALLALLVALVIHPVPAILAAAMAVWHGMSAWHMRIDPEAALSRAAAVVPFSVGHASAAVTFRGLRARPEWSVIVYSAADPPDQRALVVVDGVTGDTIGEPYVEGVAQL